MVNSSRSNRYNSGVGVPPGIGLREENIHPGSGLRVATVTGTIAAVAAANRCRQIFAGTTIRSSIGDANNTLAGTGEWVSLLSGGGTGAAVPFANQRLPLPMTPTILQIILTLDVSASRTRFRVSGFDQFGNRIVETTPWIIDTGWGLTSYFTAVSLSKVFSYVDGFEYQHNGQVNPEFSQFGLGYHAAPDPTNNEAAVALNPSGLGVTSLRYLDTEANWGIGSPLRISPYNVNAPYRFAELLGGSAVLLREVQTPTVINTATAFPIYGSVAKATGTLTFAGNAAATETVTIGTRVYTFRAAINSSSPVNEVLVGADAVASIQNLRAAINGVEGAGTTYSAGTIPHAQVECHLVTPTTLQVRSRFSGFEGNTIVTTETMGAGSWGNVTLTEGSPTAGMVLGRSLTGWEGCASKIGFRSFDNWATQVLGIGLRGNSGVPATMDGVWRDEIEFSFTVRSALGTTRDSVAV